MSNPLPRWHGPLIAPFVALCIGSLTLPIGIQPATAADAPSNDPVLDDYHRRAEALKPDDVAARYALAIWCKDRDRLDLAAKQCKAILKIDPNHSQAKLLLRIAEPPKKPRRPRTRLNRPAAPEIPRLTKKDIQRLRFAEVRLPKTAAERDRPDLVDHLVDHVPVRFNNRTLQRFWDRMQGRPGFTKKRDRVAFFKMPPVQQLGLIVANTGDDFQPDVQINGDPNTFKTFNKRIWPLLRTNCATSGCHGGINAASFRLLTDTAAAPGVLYTNFLILDTIAVGPNRMIDRDRPANSLLLSYCLPQDKSLNPHPAPPEFKSALRNEDDARYTLILDWILALQNPRPDYAVDLINFPQALRPTPSTLNLNDQEVADE